VYTGLHGFFALVLTGLPALLGLLVFAHGLRRAADVQPAAEAVG
jgi:hypothetical protein